MKLKSVEICGFKSFADKITLEFHEGITGIVGPNGCGKSNIGDAIRWVLGEQSAKAIRGGKMPDVIFGGTSSRDPLSFCAVTLTLSEIQGALPVPYDEVSITRRLYRSGESEYLINGQAARLRDVNFLFLDSGVGKNNFSIFEQGKIDQMIQYSPKDRRSIFEEAAGIQRFLQRKRETLRKLDDASLNLTRIEDIYREVEIQINHLEEQAESARIYTENKQRLSHLEKGILVSRYDSYAKKKGDLTGKERKIQSEKLEWSGKKEDLEAAWQTGKKKVSEKEAEYHQNRDALLKKQGELELKKQRQSYTEEKKKECIQNRQKGEKELVVLETELKRMAQEIQGFRQEKETQEPILNQAQVEYKSLEAELLELEKEISNARTKQTESHRARVESLQKEASIENEGKQLKFRLESHLEKKEHLELRKNNLAQVILEKEVEAEDKKTRFAALSSKIEEYRNALKKADHTLSVSSVALEAISEQFDQISRKVHETSAKLNALMQLKKEFSGFSGGGKTLLQLSQDKSHTLFGTVKGLYEYLTLQPGLEGIFSSILRIYSQTLCVETVSDLREVLKVSREKGISDFSILCLELLPDTVNSHFLNEFKNESDLEALLSKKHPTSIWTDSGLYVDGKGVFFLGGEDKGSLFAQEAEIKSLDFNLNSLLHEKEKIAEKLAEIKNERALCHEERAKADQEVRKKEMEALDAQFAFQRAQGDLERVKKETIQVDEEVASLQNQIISLKAQAEKAEIKWAEAKAAVDQMQTLSQDVESHLREKNQKWTYQKQALRERNEKVLKLEGDFRKTVHALSLLDVKHSEAEKQKNRISEEITSSLAYEQGLSLDASAAGEEFAAIGRAIDLMGKAVAEHERLLQLMKREVHVLDKERKTITDKENELEGQLHQISIQLAHVETGQSSVAVEIQERFDEKADLLIESGFKLDIGIEKAEKEIKQLKEYIAANGNVNLAAIVECEKQIERRDFLKSQKGDLGGAKDELLALIKQLDGESRELFKTTFEEIRLHFQKNFQILFKGGEADLELVDSEDVLEAGIEITARPPGKQMRSLSLLSGGEKCLTAMALLFALFEVKSSPFCILDEVDAPLDDANIDRFLNVVKSFVDRSQFVIITHNKRTMALADRLYGVSMEEKGISKLLSMEFAGDKRMVHC